MKKTAPFPLFLIAACAVLWSCRDFKIVIADQGASRYRIVKSADATPAEEQAAIELQRYVEKISGVRIPVVTDTVPFDAFEIIIGRNAHLQSAGAQIQWDELAEGGYLIQTLGPTLILVGGTGKGALYAVYGLLEDHMGCCLYAPDALYLPRSKSIILGKITDQQNPYFTWRETLHYLPNASREYADWHKLHNREDMAREWGMWVHTFERLVPASRYYDDHPEYFGELNGMRMRDGQLCLSNADVLQVTIDNLRRMMEEKPEATYWSVSQNDNYNFCTCEKCRALDQKYGSHAGSLMAFVNQVAEQFPDKVISTLAYQY
ncbi:MAG: DUF4838 domain-containing protein, partial [Calditrichaeota bacterium]